MEEPITAAAAGTVLRPHVALGAATGLPLRWARCGTGARAARSAPRASVSRPAVLAGVLALGLLAGCGPTPAEQPGAAAPSAGTVPRTSTAAPPTPGQPPTFGIGGAIGDFGVNAAADDVVPYLTRVWGAEPEVTDAETACVTSGLPGRRLVWDGLTVLVRTSDGADAGIEPYVAGWVLDEGAGTPSVGPLVTPEGLALGDPAGAVTDAYPDAVGFDSPDAGTSVWAVGPVDGDHTDDLTVYATDDVVTTIIGGQACGD